MDGITRVHQAGSDPDHRVDGSQPALALSEVKALLDRRLAAATGEDRP